MKDIMDQIAYILILILFVALGAFIIIASIMKLFGVEIE